ncbi:MAG: SMP-30/gluconolactonase/LRE family protein [Opitutaceae bacterium]|nr:SMP-30/gluconolactonase/LRE family protein [Opitutaceae bacterium]
MPRPPRPHLVVSLLALLLVQRAFGAPAPIVSLTEPERLTATVERLDATAMDALVAPGAELEILATGFTWSEGPVWMVRESQLVFSDVPENIAYRWREGKGVEVFLNPSGQTGPDEGSREPGSNGLELDAQGRLLLAQHGDRRLARLNNDGRTFTTLVARFEGRRFNSPNDLILDRAGVVYFTDPPYGLGKTQTQEIDFCGVYRFSTDGALSVVSRELSRPNGIGLSPGDRVLYVANSDGARPIIMAFDLRGDGTAGPGRVFFDGAELTQRTGRRGAFDGLSVDEHGNLWATGPGGVLVLSPEGRHLGTLLTGRATANCCFGGPGGRTLFVTADDRLMRLETKVRGVQR